MLSGSAIDSETVVLIVENNPDHRDMLVEICRQVGFAHTNIRDLGFDRKNIKVAAELEKATGILNRGEVDLVLLDLALDEADEDVMPALLLLARWNKETIKKKIPVIVVSAYTNQLEQAELQSCFAVIPKPGPSDGEKGQFSAFLKFAIRTAIAQRSEAATLGERIRQQFDRIVTRIVPGNPHIHLAPGVSYPVSNTLSRAGVAVFVVGCYSVFLITFAKTHGWPMKPVMWSLAGLLLAVIVWAVITSKRPLAAKKK